MRTMPYVDENGTKVDLNSRLLSDNIILLQGEINADLSELIIAEMLYLSSKDPKKPIEIYANSPGGSIQDGLAIVDTGCMISNPVNVTCVGVCASMAAFILAAANSMGGKRYATPNSSILIHQPLSGIGTSQATDFDIHARNLARTTLRMLALKAKYTGHTLEEIIKASERDNCMTAEEALEFGIIDEILYPEGEEPIHLPKIPSYNITSEGGLANLEKNGYLDEYVKRLGIKIR